MQQMQLEVREKREPNMLGHVINCIIYIILYNATPDVSRGNRNPWRTEKYLRDTGVHSGSCGVVCFIFIV